MPIFAIVDCNSFFCSCERLINPSLKGKPVIVLSNNDGMVVARSKEAKEIGISWDAYHLIRDKIRYYNVQVFSSNYPLYSEISGRVMTVLKEFAPLVEIYSCDEAFLDLTGEKDLEAYGRLIRETVLQYCGIPVSIGIAETKTLAKLANRIAKKSPKIRSGVLNLVGSPYQDEALKRVNVEHIWGVGRRWSKRLNSYGIITAYDLANTDINWVLKHFNVILARTTLELQGQFCLPLQLAPPISKTIVSSMSFGKLITEYDSIKQAISTYAAESAAKMRRERLSCRIVHVYLETNRFMDEPQYNPWVKIPLSYETQDTGEIIHTALIGLDSIFEPGYRYQKGGVMVDGLVPSGERQASLLDFTDRERSNRLMQALDNVNSIYGPGTLRYGSQGMRNSAYRMRQNHLSTQTKHSTRMSDFQDLKKICELGQSTPLFKSL